MKKEVIDLTEDEIIEEVKITEEYLSEKSELVEEKVTKKKKAKTKKEIKLIKKIKEFYTKLSKKQKILFIAGIIIFLILMVILIGSFFWGSEEIEEEVIEPIVISMGNYKYVDGTLIFLDEDDNELGSYECIIADETKCYLTIEYAEEILDVPVDKYNDGELVSKNLSVYENYVFVNDDDTLYLYDLELNEVVEELLSVKSVYDNIFIIESLDSMFAYVDLTYEYNPSFSYEYLGYTIGEYLAYESGLIKISSSEKFKIDSVYNYNESYVVSDDFNLYNYSGDKLLSGYTYIKLYDDYIYAFEGSDLYVYDANLNKLNEVAIEVSITDYTDYNVYDESLTLLRNDYVLDYELLSNKTLKVEGVSLNLYDAIINSKLSYYSYFDGTIYVYSDKDKTDVIGTYGCSVENSVSSSTDTYSSCYLANDSVIVNERYAFIYDTETLSANANYSLVDLSTGKSLASYQDFVLVDTAVSGIVHSTESYLVKATNTTGSVGMITLSTSGAKGFISFDYKYTDITQLDDLYVATNSEGYKFLHDSDGTLKTSSSNVIKSDIVGATSDFNYIMVYNSNSYQIYSNSGTIISSTYDSIIMGTNNYCAQKDDEIYIYDYLGDTNYFIEDIDFTYNYYSFIEVSSSLAKIVFYDETGNIISTIEVDLTI